MSKYQHSESFASLKNVKEQVTDNLTSYQWLTTLDFFIESALDPIATGYPDFLDNYFAKVVAHQTLKPAVKFSRNKKEVLPALLFNSLTTEGKDKRVFQKAMLFNRGVLLGALNVYHATVTPYMDLHALKSKLPKGRRRLLIRLAEDRTSAHLYAATIESQFYAKKAYEFKELIVQKYVRMTLMSAKRVYSEVAYQIRLDDIIQTYLLYLSKAIDRCDARQGVLTTFIQTWFYSARSEIHRSVAGEQHLSYEEMLEGNHHLGVTHPDCKYETLQHVRATAKLMDPCGALRFAVGVPEFFTAQQIALLKKQKSKPQPTEGVNHGS